MKPTYREKTLLDYLFGGFRSTLKTISSHHLTHTVSHVTHTRHTIVVDTPSEKREVDLLHHEK